MTIPKNYKIVHILTGIKFKIPQRKHQEGNKTKCSHPAFTLPGTPQTPPNLKAH